MRVTLACRMKMIVAKQFDTTNRLLKVTLSLHKDKKYSIKLNSAVRSNAGQEVAKGYAPAAVNRNLRVKWAGNRDALKEMIPAT